MICGYEFKVCKVIVSELGVFIYFVSEYVVVEYFELDVMVCGVISIVYCF